MPGGGVLERQPVHRMRNLRGWAVFGPKRVVKVWDVPGGHVFTGGRDRVHGLPSRALFAGADGVHRMQNVRRRLVFPGGRAAEVPGLPTG